MKSRGIIAPTGATTAVSGARTNFRKLCILVLTSALLVATAVRAHSATGTLSWDAVTDPGTAGYKLHYGTVSGTYTNSVDTGVMTSYTVTNLTEGRTYYFAVTAYNTSGNESGYSNEVSKSIPSGSNYTLEISKVGSGSGTVSGSGINCGSVCSNTFAPGTAVTLTAKPASGSTFAGWSGACSGTGTCTVTMNSSASVTATFNSTALTYSITATAKGGGTITAVSNPNVTQGTSGDTTVSVVKVTKGANQIFTIAPKTGNYTASVSVNGTQVAKNVGNYSYTFSNVTGANTIDATFASAAYTVTASAGTGGTISPASARVSHGASQSFKITPNSGYKVADVQVDGASVGAVTSYTVSNVTANRTIRATFTSGSTGSTTSKSYTITASAGTGGTISPAGAVKVNGGSSRSFTITPSNTGYRILDVKVDGVSKGAISSYTFSGVTANHTIQASFTTNYSTGNKAARR